MRRRGKGEASFLHCKSPGREEPDVTNRGRGMKGEKEAKRDKREEKTEKERERWKLRWSKRKCGKEEGRNRGKERRRIQGNKMCWMRAEREGRHWAIAAVLTLGSFLPNLSPM